jgi:hypothetical protein
VYQLAFLRKICKNNVDIARSGYNRPSAKFIVFRRKNPRAGVKKYLEFFNYR